MLWHGQNYVALVQSIVSLESSADKFSIFTSQEFLDTVKNVLERSILCRRRAHLVGLRLHLPCHCCISDMHRNSLVHDADIAWYKTTMGLADIFQLASVCSRSNNKPRMELAMNAQHV